LGTFLGQGYLYGRPLSAVDLRDELAERNLLAQPQPAVPSARDSRSA